MTEAAIPVISGWREALVSVHDLDGWVAAYALLGGWEVRHRGQLDAATLRFLGLPEDVAAETVLLAEPGSTNGFARLVRFATAAPAPVIRSNARPWETGGWFDLNVRVENMDTSFALVQELGWSGESDPIQWQFSDVIVKEWLVRGPDGIVFALIERIDPPLPAAEQPGAFSAHMNATQFVTDIEAARHFYQHVLGFRPLIEVTDEYFVPAPAPNVLGLPSAAAAQQKWNISLQQAPGEPGGWVEILSLPGSSGRDFGALANPPNRGIISLRFPVDDVHKLHRHLQLADIPILQTPERLTLEPYGAITMLTAQGPHGARLDFFTVD